MVNGFFLGGAQTGIAQRRESDRQDRTVALAEKSQADDLRIRERGLGLQAAELGLSERRLNADIENNQSGRAIQEKGLSLQERSLKIQEQAQANKEKQDTATRADGIIANIMSTIKETATALRATGKKPEEVAAVVKPLTDQVVSLSEITGLKSDHYVNQVNTIIAQPTAVETAAAAGAAKATEKVGEVQALQNAGVSEDTARKTAGVKIDDKEIELRTFLLPDGQMVSKKATDATGISEVLARGGFETKLSVQSADVSGLSSSSVPDKKTVAETRKAIRDSQANIEELDKTAKAFEKNPEAAGVVGALIEHIGGLVAQVPFGVGKEVLDRAGVDMKGVTKARTQARAAIGQVLRMVSQDNSRFSNSDRELAERTIRTLDSSADDQTVQEALSTTQEIMKRQQLKDVDVARVAAKLSISDLETDEGIDKLGDVLTNNGMTPEQAIDAIASLRERFGLKGNPTAKAKK